MKIDVVIGLQYGDEGKGKVTDWLLDDERYQGGIRWGGGDNCGHTIFVDGTCYVFHIVPSCVLHNKPGFIGAGVVVNPISLVDEIKRLKKAGFDVALHIDKNATLIVPIYRVMDKYFDGLRDKPIGTTCKGIGPAYVDRANRKALTFNDVSDGLRDKYYGLLNNVLDDYSTISMLYDASEDGKWFDAIDYLKDHVNITTAYHYLQSGHWVAEGGQGAALDLLHGDYPFVTSSSTIAGGVCTGAGVSPRSIRDVIGVFKAYTTRVGNGKLVGDMPPRIAKEVVVRGNEYGATTGRERRVAWLNVEQLKKSIWINGANILFITKVDVLQGVPTICVVNNAGETLREFDGWYNTKNAVDDRFMDFKRYIEDYIGQKINFVSDGPGRYDFLEV